MPQHNLIPAGPGYGLMMAAAIFLGAIYWHRRVKGNPDLLLIYIGALCGAFLGAKLAYLLAEGWLDIGRPDLWLRWATGKSVLGGLLGGYAGVEWTKRLVGHRQSTGDAFALVLPVSLFLGRIGCHFHGCCLGKPMTAGFFARADDSGLLRWPAPQVEAAFQVLMFVAIAALHRRGLLRDRLFFLFLVSYGLFRFAHEFVRDTPKPCLGFSGYQFLALGIACLGGWMLKKRSGFVA